MFTFNGNDSSGTLGTNIDLFIDGQASTSIHTSCSQPIGPGLVKGPFTITAGASLKGGPLCPLTTPPGGSCSCSGKVTMLSLLYGGVTAARVQVTEKDGAQIYDDMVAPGQVFTFSGQDKDGTMGTNIEVWVNGTKNTDIHTSCSQPIGPGLVYGSFTVTAGKSLKGGDLCPNGSDSTKK
jgi:hypothetical protein